MAHEWAKALVAASFLTATVYALMGIPEWRQGTAPQESIEGIAVHLFDVWLFAFLVLGLLLLVALVGALYVSQKRVPDPEERP